MTYMNVTEVESALVALAAAHPTICELITLPNLTPEGRTTHAVRIGTQPANTVDAYFLTGGVHAREWGSCEILVNLAIDLCDAYGGGTGVGYGGKYFSAAEVKALVEQLNVLIYPCVNPDGRNFSQTAADAADMLWRRNRNPAYSGGDAARIGVDINRNQDFLWDFRTKFAPGAVNSFLASDDTSVETYHGPAAASEAETKNVDHLHDTYTRIRWYVDVHSFSEDILYVWGDDESQLGDAGKTFTNAAYDGQRGLLGDSYGEYIEDGDLSALEALAAAFTRSLAEVRGKLYVAKPGFSLYATSGTNDDYAYSRHIVDPSKARSLSFTVEWGTEFQPPWSEMQEIVKDVSAGLIGLGLEALGIDSYIVTNRDTFSSYEVETTKAFGEAFYVVVDGFAPSALGLPGTDPQVRFLGAIGGAEISAVSATRTATDMEDPGAPGTPQRVQLTYEVDFADASPFTAETRTIYLEVTVGGIVDVAPIELVKQPNPYMVDGAVSWLSTDVRVFQLAPGGRANPSSAVVLGDPDADANAPYAYVQSFLAELRAAGNTPTPAFESLSEDEEASQLELSRTVGGVRVCNFAVAKVRYRAKTVDAPGVRVFFRTFNTMVSDLTYTTSAFADVKNYRRTADGTTPLLGTNAFFSGAGNQIVSIPYFAEARVDTGVKSMATQPDATNQAPLDHAGATEALQYFGCWLDFNQTEAQFPVNVPSGNDGPFTGRVPIPQLVRGIHQCLVAEVRFQPGATDPIPNGASPASSDRLAQRNLAIVESDNPGTAATHVVSHTLLVKPTRLPKRAASQAERGPDLRPDELVIRWNGVPRGTAATLYFPDWSADAIVALAAARPGPPALRRVDAHTIGVTVSDISFIPLPGEVARPSPGLLTLELPESVRTGQRFHLDVQQHAGPTYRRSLAGRGDARRTVRQEYDLSARKVLGAFRLTTAVQEGEPLLAKQVRNLAALKYIHQAIPETDSWHAVFVRYIAQLADKVRGLGVDPGLVPPSLDDPGLPGRGHGHGRGHAFTGKICDVVFDCFGDLEGFTVETCDGRVRVRSTERRIGELAWKACRECAVVTVRVEGGVLRELAIRSGWPA